MISNTKKNEQQLKALEYFNKGVKNSNLQDYKGAISDFGKAIEEKPNFASTYYNRGICKIKLSKKNEGNLDVAKAEKLGYKIKVL